MTSRTTRNPSFISKFRPYISGILPLFVFAHFGHHVAGAMMRPLLPMIRTDLNLSYTQSGMVMSAFAITSGLSQLPAGWLADRFGTRLMVLFGIAGTALAGFFIGLSNSYVTLLIFLVISAMMGGGYHPASSAAISSAVSPERRGRALGIHLIGGSSAFWIVPLLAAPIAIALGWRSPFLILTIPTIILGFLLYILIGKQHRARTREAKAQEADGKEPETAIKINWRRLAPFILMSVSIGTLVMSISAYLSLYAVDDLGISELTAANLMAISPFVGVVAAPVGGYLSDRFGSIQVLTVISFLTLPLVYLMGVAGSALALAGVMVALGLVTNTRMPTSESFIAGNTPDNRRATILGFYFFAGAEVAGLLTPVIGIMADRIGFPSTFAISASVTGVIVLVCALLLWKSKKPENKYPEITG